MTDHAPVLSTSESRAFGSLPPLWSRSLVTVCLVVLFGAMVPNLFVIAPRYLGALGFSKGEIGSVMGAYQVAVLIVTPFVVPAAARIGFGRLLAIGGLICGFGAWGFSSTNHLSWLMVFRALQGVGFACIMVGAAAFVAETAPKERLGEAMGVTGIVTLVAQALGPVVAETLQQQSSYQTAFASGLIAGMLAAAIAWALPRAQAVVLRSKVNLFRSRAALLALALSGVGFGAVWLFLADYARTCGISSINWYFWPYVVAALFSRIALGKLSDRRGRRKVAIPALAAHVVAFIGFYFISEPWHLIPIGLIYGLAHGLYYPGLQALVVETAVGPRAKAAAASTFAFGVGILVAAYLLGPVAEQGGYRLMYMLSAAAAVVALVALALDRQGRSVD